MSRKVLGLICVAAMAIAFSAQDASAGLFNRGGRGGCCEPRQRCCREPRQRCCREPRERCCREPRQRCCEPVRCCQPRTSCCNTCQTRCQPRSCGQPAACGCGGGAHHDGYHDGGTPEPAPAPAVEDAPPPPAAA